MGHGRARARRGRARGGGGRPQRGERAHVARPIFASYLAARVGLAADSPAFEAYLARSVALGQHAGDSADSLNFARRWWQLPFPGMPPRRVLLQEGIGDQLVWNVLTEELAMVAGLPTNLPQTDADGVAGHWIFEPPGGHGIFDRPDVQAQAAVFLASEGTALVDPAAARASTAWHAISRR